jgi:transcriptional regulator with XRE-family HTH domain
VPDVACTDFLGRSTTISGMSRLRQARERCGMTQLALAGAVGVSQQTVARWESGRTPAAKHLRALARALELPLADLLVGDTLAAGSGGQSSALAAVADVVNVDEDPFGTLRLDFSPVGEEEWFSAQEHADATEWTPREYPIAVGTWRRVSQRLNAPHPRVSWLWFATLDDRVVLANLHELEAIALITEEAEGIQSFEEEQVYQALRDPRMHALLTRSIEEQVVAVSDSPFSVELYEACRRYVAEAGGLELIHRTQRTIGIETARGWGDNIALDDEKTEAREIQGLIAAIEHPNQLSVGRPPMNDWVLNLSSDGRERTTYYRLGALRLIEAPRALLPAEANHR